MYHFEEEVDMHKTLIENNKANFLETLLHKISLN